MDHEASFDLLTWRKLISLLDAKVTVLSYGPPVTEQGLAQWLARGTPLRFASSHDPCSLGDW